MIQLVRIAYTLPLALALLVAPVHAGKLFVVVEPTDYGRAWIEACIDNAARDLLPQPQYADGIVDDVYAILYVEDATGDTLACPGNGDQAITEAFVAALVAGYLPSSARAFWREQGDTAGLTPLQRGGSEFIGAFPGIAVDAVLTAPSTE